MRESVQYSVNPRFVVPKVTNQPLIISMLQKKSLKSGAGPGTGTLAAKQIFPALRYSTLLERDCAFAEIGKELAEYALDQTLAMHWQIGDVEKMPSHALHDLVVASYSLGELAENSWEKVVIRLWRATNRAFVIVEPGTPRGYHRLMQMRQVLIQQGAYIAGPCPHQKECPLAKGDWCHFSVRVSRTSLHRKLKLAELGYEDEKFCYIICIKDSTDSAFLGKVIRHPKKGKGYIKIVTCREQGIQEETYSKKDAGLYQMMKQLEWGSDLPII